MDKKPTEEIDIQKLAQDAAKRINEEVNQSKSSIIQIQSGGYVKEIEINDSPNRFVLTKGSTHEEVLKATEAIVLVKGKYYKEGEKPGLGDERPLYLHITANSEERLKKALEMIDKLMITPSTFIGKVYLGIENAPQSFNIPANVIGPKGVYVKHITQYSGGTRVQLKGRGSSFKEPETGEESNEPIHLHLSANSKENLDKAKALADNLLCKVRRDFLKFLQNTPQAYQKFLDFYYSQPYFQNQQMNQFNQMNQMNQLNEMNQIYQTQEIVQNPQFSEAPPGLENDPNYKTFYPMYNQMEQTYQVEQTTQYLPPPGIEDEVVTNFQKKGFVQQPQYIQQQMYQMEPQVEEYYEGVETIEVPIERKKREKKQKSDQSQKKVKTEENQTNPQ